MRSGKWEVGNREVGDTSSGDKVNKLERRDNRVEKKTWEKLKPDPRLGWGRTECLVRAVSSTLSLPLAQAPLVSLKDAWGGTLK